VTDDIHAVEAILNVSRETSARLEAFVALIRKWQPVENLISPATLPQIWHRHIADGAELYARYPHVSHFADLGTGAGLPGIVLAILGTGRPGFHVELVESNQRKCAFLRTVIRETGAPASVHNGRAEQVVPTLWQDVINHQAGVNHNYCVTSRALASLTMLLGFALPQVKRGAIAAFHKGEDWQREVEEARRSWDFALTAHPSQVGQGAILEISALRPRPESA
jgi:16S rRNA (guanine527-N7)-methyltransferase